MNFIKNIPKCVDCKHFFFKEKNVFSTSKCKQIIYNSLDTKRNNFEYSYIARSEEKLCGPSGTKFEPKKNKKL
jgi:hypothetical protein